MSYTRLHKIYEEKIEKLPFSIVEVNYGEKPELVDILEEAILNNQKLTNEQLKLFTDITENKEGERY
tara:strand:- start:70 stop:270 length:201 start_codon:yes stop_codon:yes gene_type:complete